MKRRNMSVLAALSTAALLLFAGCSNATAEQSAKTESSSSASAADQGVQQISVTEAAQRMDKGVRIVDVREPGEYSAGHIPGVELVPLATVAKAAAGWDKDQPLMLICRSGNRSNIAAHKLEDLGFKDLANVQGGMNAWRGATMTGSARGAR